MMSNLTTIYWSLYDNDSERTENKKINPVMNIIRESFYEPESVKRSRLKARRRKVLAKLRREREALDKPKG